jgi:hypothetical protein
VLSFPAHLHRRFWRKRGHHGNALLQRGSDPFIALAWL